MDPSHLSLNDNYMHVPPVELNGVNPHTFDQLAVAKRNKACQLQQELIDFKNHGFKKLKQDKENHT